mmetsp:Transcript_71718/g.232160  ORF Transcript_71718/g.232160 Transcript_71718/m.232160 type:complete len:138 (-) Transcript_71718:64-477(-)
MYAYAVVCGYAANLYVSAGEQMPGCVQLLDAPSHPASRSYAAGVRVVGVGAHYERAYTLDEAHRKHPEAVRQWLRQRDSTAKPPLPPPLQQGCGRDEPGLSEEGYDVWRRGMRMPSGNGKALMSPSPRSWTARPRPR